MKLKDIFEGDVVSFRTGTPSRRDPLAGNPEGGVLKFPERNQIRQLLSIPIHGHPDLDKHLWRMLDQFIMNERNPMQDRIAALKRLDQIHGDVKSTYTANDVYTYLEAISDTEEQM